MAEKKAEQDLSEFEELGVNSQSATSKKPQIAAESPLFPPIDPFIFFERAQKDFQRNYFQSAKSQFSMVIEQLASKENRSPEEDKLLNNAYFGRGLSIMKMPPLNLLEATTQKHVQYLQEQFYKDLEMAKNDFSQIYPYVTTGVKEYLEGLLHLKKGDKKEAEGRFNAAIEKDSQFTADCYSELGQLELINNNIGKAIYCFTEAIRLAPSKSDFYKHRAFAHYYNKEWLNALADCIAAQKLGGEPVCGPLNWCFNALQNQIVNGAAAQDNELQKILMECLNNHTLSQIFFKEMGKLTQKQILNIINKIPAGPEKDRLLKACLEQQLEIGKWYWYYGSPNKDQIHDLIEAISNPEEQKFYFRKALEKNPQLQENQQDILYLLCHKKRLMGNGTTNTMWDKRSELCQRNVSEELLDDYEEDSWEKISSPPGS